MELIFDNFLMEHSGPLELQVQIVVGHHVGAEKQTLVLCKSSKSTHAALQTWNTVLEKSCAFKRS